MPKQIVAVREFPGLVTEKESAARRTEDALVRDNFDFDNLSFKTLQYNPPYTLPWVRRNEVLLVVTSMRQDVDESVVRAKKGVIEQKEQRSRPSDLMTCRRELRECRRICIVVYVYGLFTDMLLILGTPIGGHGLSSCILYLELQETC